MRLNLDRVTIDLGDPAKRDPDPLFDFVSVRTQLYDNAVEYARYSLHTADQMLRLIAQETVLRTAFQRDVPGVYEDLHACDERRQVLPQRVDYGRCYIGVGADRLVRTTDVQIVRNRRYAGYALGNIFNLTALARIASQTCQGHYAILCFYSDLVGLKMRAPVQLGSD